MTAMDAAYTHKHGPNYAGTWSLLGSGASAILGTTWGKDGIIEFIFDDNYETNATKPGIYGRNHKRKSSIEKVTAALASAAEFASVYPNSNKTASGDYATYLA